MLCAVSMEAKSRARKRATAQASYANRRFADTVIPNHSKRRK